VAGNLTGTVKNSAGNFVARTVRAYLRATGALVGSTTSSATTGVWNIVTANTDPHYAVVLGVDAAENGLILDHLVPIGAGLSPHRYWRFIFTEINDPNGFPDAYLIFRELELLEGTTDWTTGLGGSASHSSNSLLQGFASALVDNTADTAGTRWNGTYTWSMDLGAVRAIDGISVTADAPTNAPKAWRVEASDDNSAWTEVKVFSAQTAWGTGERRAFSLA
jgi:hypothetical protein